MAVNFELLKEYDRLDCLRRYNHKRTITVESVASHSYYVALYTQMICSHLDLCPAVSVKALTHAVYHDIGEIYLSDIPYDTKEKFPIVKRMLSGVEEEVIKEHFPQYSELWKEVEDRKDEESLLIYNIIKLADILSVIQYTSREYSLGNTVLDAVREEAVNGRYKTYKEAIEELTGKVLDIFEIKE